MFAALGGVEDARETGEGLEFFAHEWSNRGARSVSMAANWACGACSRCPRSTAVQGDDVAARTQENAPSRLQPLRVARRAWCMVGASSRCTLRWLRRRALARGTGCVCWRRKSQGLQARDRRHRPGTSCENGPGASQPRAPAACGREPSCLSTNYVPKLSRFSHALPARSRSHCPC